MPGFGGIGIWEVILILAILLLVFGAKRLPEIGSALGRGIREFKGSVKDIENEINRPTPRNDLPRSEPPRADTPRETGTPSATTQADAPRAEGPRTEVPRAEAPRSE